MSVFDPRDWRGFEKIVTAIHRAQDKGAVVTWNDRINGRQFDVSIRFRHGFYEFLTVLECKATSRPVSVKDVEAFVTKSQDASANKAVVASIAGFQSGCHGVARRHKIALVTVTDASEIPEELLTGDDTPALQIYDIVFHLTDGSKCELEDRDGKLEYLARRGRIRTENGDTPIDTIIKAIADENRHNISSEAAVFDRTFNPGAQVFLPDSDRVLHVSRLSLTAVLVTVKVMRPLSPDPRIIGKAYSLRDELSGEVTTIPGIGLEIGADTQIEEGKFYRSPGLESHYFCESIQEDLIRFVLVESYQHGTLFQAVFTQRRKHAKSYIEVEDKSEIRRLTAMLRRIQDRGEETSP